MKDIVYGVQKPREDRVDLTEAYWQKFIPVIWKTIESKKKALNQLLSDQKHKRIMDQELLNIKILSLRNAIKTHK